MEIRHFSGLFSMVSLLVAFVGGHATPSHAGFDYGQPQAEAMPSVTYKGSPAPKKQAPLVLSNDVTTSEKESPAFEVYQERYVPDTVKKKYGLNDDWYGNKPQPLVPDSMATPVPATIEPTAQAIEKNASATQAGIIVPPPLFARIPKEVLNELRQIPATIPAENAPITAAIEPAAGTPDTVIIQGQPRNYTQSWRARKGENFRDVLRRWSERENTELMWASPDNPTLGKDFSYFGKYQDAVARLMASNPSGTLHSQYRSEGLAPTMMTPASRVTTTHAEPQQPVPLTPTVTEPLNRTAAQQGHQGQGGVQPYVPAMQKVSTETRWLSLTGAPMSEVLRVWSEDAGVNLIWQSERDYAMRASVSKVGTFEDAVYTALSQYDDAPVRPVGEMYRDSSTGQSYLIVHDDAGQ